MDPFDALFFGGMFLGVFVQTCLYFVIKLWRAHG